MRRLFFLFLPAAFVSLFICIFPVHADNLILKPAGEPRPLRGPIFGASTTAFYERLLEDPAKIAMLSQMSVGLSRFPGGSDANFYNWCTGLIEIKSRPDSSAYVRFWAKAAENIARGKPDGVTMEQFESFSRKIGAQVILVPNLESSSVDEQTEWFKNLAGEGIVPHRIELGNEFWVAMGNDPASLARWPDEPTSMRIMKRYLDALKPYLPVNAKVAVQAAAGAVDVNKGQFGQRLRQWDEDLHPEPWFDAVTVHLYPRLRDVMGNPEAGITPPTPENAASRLNAMMGRVDEGTERILRDLERRLPGKEIWITEWNTRGANPETQRGNAKEPMSPAMEMLTTTRMALVHLRHPSVTASLFFMYSFRPRDPHAMFVSDRKGNYAPVPAAAALRWLSEAANNGDSFQRVVREGEPRIPGGGAKDESYFPVEGGFFESPGRTTLLLENVSSTNFIFDPLTLIKGLKPNRVETLAVPNLVDPEPAAAKIETQDPAGPIAVPPFSLTRIVWEKSPKDYCDAAAGIHKIKHVIIIMQENRSFDHYFGTYPGADGIPMKDGVPTVSVYDPLTKENLKPYHDINDLNHGGPHGMRAGLGAIDDGKMDGFMKVIRLANEGKARDNKLNPYRVNPGVSQDVMGYHDRREIPNYWNRKISMPIYHQQVSIYLNWSQNRQRIEKLSPH